MSVADPVSGVESVLRRSFIVASGIATSGSK
jgi:hypothetical protein